MKSNTQIVMKQLADTFPKRGFDIQYSPRGVIIYVDACASWEEMFRIERLLEGTFRIGHFKLQQVAF